MILAQTAVTVAFPLATLALGFGVFWHTKRSLASPPPSVGAPLPGRTTRLVEDTMQSDLGSEQSPYAQQISALAQAVTELARTVSSLASLPDQNNTYSSDEIESVDAAREGIVELNQRAKALLQARSGG